MRGYKTTYGALSAVGILLLFSLASWFLVLPYLTNVFERVQLKNELIEQVVFSKNWEENYNELVKYRAEIEDVLQVLRKNRIELGESYLLIDSIYETAESTFVQILSINPSERSLNDGTQKFIELELNGRYHAIANFINNLESGSYPLTIPEIQLSRMSNTNLLLASITMNVEYTSN